MMSRMNNKRCSNPSRLNLIRMLPALLVTVMLLLDLLAVTALTGEATHHERLPLPDLTVRGSFMISRGSAQSARILVAHRGASAYAPEHTLEAYRMAIEQGADYVEQDLQITSDGVLVCLHDATLERTTDVEKIFPERARILEGQPRWLVADFTLAEIRRLDAGSWFDQKFAGARVPTWQEAIDLIRGQAGLFPETKGPEDYRDRGFDMERMVIETLRRNGLDRPGADPRTPVIIQSFSAPGLQKLRNALGTRLPLVLLIGKDAAAEWLSPAGLRRAARFAKGIGPEKRLIDANPSIVKNAHRLGLTVTPYTFRSSKTAPYADVRTEMEHYLYRFNVDSLFTDNPDQFPRAPESPRKGASGNGG